MNLLNIITNYKNTSENGRSLRISLKNKNLGMIVFVYIVCKILNLGYYRNKKEIDIYTLTGSKFCSYCGNPIKKNEPPLIIEQHYYYSNCDHPELDRTDVYPIYDDICKNCKETIREDIWDAMTSILERSEET